MPSSARKTPSAKPSQRSTSSRASVRNSRGMPLADPAPPVDKTGALKPGSAVEGHVLRSLVDRDDFVLRYRASSNAADEADVLIEEYWPSALVDRGPEGEPVPRDATLAALVDAGLEAFIAEAAQLAAIDHPALVKLGPAWRQRGTACRLRAEPLARTLARHMEGRPRPPDERWLRVLAEALLRALDAVHRAGRIHGNLRPGNVLLRADESPVLLDFGAAPAAIARIVPWRAPRAEPAFDAPELQLYGSVPTPAADLYSLAALLWFCSTGELPPKSGAAPSNEPRWDGVLRRHPSLRYSAGWMEAIDTGLAFDAEARPQNVEAFRRLLVERPVLAVVSPVVTAIPGARTPTVAPSAPVQPSAPVAASSALDPLPDPSWSGLDIGPAPTAPTAPMHDLLAAPSSRLAPFDALPPMRADADDDREPAWQLDDFASAVLETPRAASPPPVPPLRSTPRADDAPWPSMASRPGIFDAPEPDIWPSRRPAPARKSRHWPWAIGGALLGGFGMLAVGLGWHRVEFDPQIERLLSQAVNMRAEEPVAPPAPPAATTETAPRDPGPAGPPTAEPVPARSGAPVHGRAATVDVGTAAATGSSTVTPVQAGTPPRAPARDEAEPPRKAEPARNTTVAEADPATACAPRSNFSLYLCMKTQCERTAWYAHPQCVALRREDER